MIQTAELFCSKRESNRHHRAGAVQLGTLDCGVIGLVVSAKRLKNKPAELARIIHQSQCARTRFPGNAERTQMNGASRKSPGFAAILTAGTARIAAIRHFFLANPCMPQLGE